MNTSTARTATEYRMRKTALLESKLALALAVLFSSAAVNCAWAAPRSVTLHGEYGCGLLASQLDRLDAMRTVAASAELRAQGAETEQSKLAQQRAAAEIVRISQTQCRVVKGTYRAVELRPIPGGEAVRIEPTKYESLWVIGPF